ARQLLLPRTFSLPAIAHVLETPRPLAVPSRRLRLETLKAQRARVDPGPIARRARPMASRPCLPACTVYGTLLGWAKAQLALIPVAGTLAAAIGWTAVLMMVFARSRRHQPASSVWHFRRHKPLLLRTTAHVDARDQASLIDGCGHHACSRPRRVFRSARRRSTSASRSRRVCFSTASSERRSTSAVATASV